MSKRRFPLFLNAALIPRRRHCISFDYGLKRAVARDQQTKLFPTITGFLFVAVTNYMLCSRYVRVIPSKQHLDGNLQNVQVLIDTAGVLDPNWP